MIGERGELSALSSQEWERFSAWDYLVQRGDDLAERAIRLLKKRRWFGSYSEDRDDIKQMLCVMLSEGLQRVIQDNRGIQASEREHLLLGYINNVLRTQFLRVYRVTTDACGTSLEEHEMVRYAAAGEAERQESRSAGLRDPLEELIEEADELEEKQRRHTALEERREEYTRSQHLFLRQHYVDETPIPLIAKSRNVSEQNVRVCLRTVLRRAKKLDAPKRASKH